MENVNVTTAIDWNKELDGDESEVCNTQATMFEFCQYKLNCDAFDFVNKFMYSEIASDMDNGDILYADSDPLQLLETIPEVFPLVPMSEKKSIDALHWIGYLYRYWAWLGVPSKDIIQTLPVEKAYAAYNGLHTLSIREAIRLLLSRTRTGIAQ